MSSWLTRWQPFLLQRPRGVLGASHSIERLHPCAMLVQLTELVVLYNLFSHLPLPTPHLHSLTLTAAAGAIGADVDVCDGVYSIGGWCFMTDYLQTAMQT